MQIISNTIDYSERVDLAKIFTDEMPYNVDITIYTDNSNIEPQYKDQRVVYNDMMKWTIGFLVTNEILSNLGAGQIKYKIHGRIDNKTYEDGYFDMEKTVITDKYLDTDTETWIGDDSSDEGEHGNTNVNINLQNYYTKTQIDNKVSDITNNYVKKTDISTFIDDITDNVNANLENIVEEQIFYLTRTEYVYSDNKDNAISNIVKNGEYNRFISYIEADHQNIKKCKIVISRDFNNYVVSYGNVISASIGKQSNGFDFWFMDTLWEDNDNYDPDADLVLIQPSLDLLRLRINLASKEADIYKTQDNKGSFTAHGPGKYI